MTGRVSAGLLLSLAAGGAALAQPAGDDAWSQFVIGRHDRAAGLLATMLEKGEEPAAAGLGLAAIHQARGDVGAAVDALLDALEREAEGPLAGGAVAALGMFVRELDPREERARVVLETLLQPDGARLDAETRALAALALADVLLRSGHREEALDVTGRIAGRIESWTLLGPYGRFDRLSFDRAHAPERGDLTPVDDAVTVVGERPLRVPARFAGGRVSLPSSMRRSGTAYAVTDVEVDRELSLRLRLSSPLSVKVFLDGRPALVVDRYRGRPARAVAARVTLAPGRHRILVKMPAGEREAHFTLALSPDEGSA
ncbi:MAG: hypothetical protein OEQ13_03930, partial [Acidobacteriota bacterium]|nr:hypothetical protein [Acidobacteriota bacterium]